MSMFELFLVSGGMLAYWVTYGCSLHLPATKIQWRTPLSLQIILAVIVFASALVIPESPRWLAKQNRFVEAKANLCYLRAAQSDSEDIIEEGQYIRLIFKVSAIDQPLSWSRGQQVRRKSSVISQPSCQRLTLFTSCRNTRSNRAGARPDQRKDTERAI